MNRRFFAALAALVLIAILFAPAPARAAGGGSTLPFNDTLTLIQDNLTGPTANTIVVLLIVCGLITVGISKETPWLRTLGGLAVICALIAKAATLPSSLGLGSANSVADSYLAPAALLSITWLIAAAAPLLPFLKASLPSSGTRG
ncbi:MAG TPA: TrbC/VirB2 family protein [Thermoanaerobaculia bacterium]|nr:TrbC/VirB2 family protein [Thermoanaerobaculia bacterium]